jgi:hypothetical protein
MLRDLLEASAGELRVDLMLDDSNSPATGEIAGRHSGR